MTGQIFDHNVMVCEDYGCVVPDGSYCPMCKVHHDMQSMYILLAGYPLPDPPRRVLIVDDNEAVLDAMSASFEAWGYQVCTEESGDRALQSYQMNGPFVFVLSDFSFVPGKKIKNGAMLVQAILGFKPRQELAVMTGEPRTARETLGALTLPDVRILAKPFELRDLKELVQKAEVLALHGIQHQTSTQQQ